MKRVIRFGCTVLAATAVACGGTQDPGTDPGKKDVQSVENRITLAQFQSCTELETYIEDTAVKQMKSMFDHDYYGWGPMAGRGAPEAAMDNAGS
ncbi:MAG: hypothetical protein ACK4N5_12710, partial [Myxococcales bacterium]